MKSTIDLAADSQKRGLEEQGGGLTKLSFVEDIGTLVGNFFQGTRDCQW